MINPSRIDLPQALRGHEPSTVRVLKQAATDIQQHSPLADVGMAVAGAALLGAMGFVVYNVVGAVLIPGWGNR